MPFCVSRIKGNNTQRNTPRRCDERVALRTSSSLSRPRPQPKRKPGNKAKYILSSHRLKLCTSCRQRKCTPHCGGDTLTDDRPNHGRAVHNSKQSEQLRRSPKIGSNISLPTHARSLRYPVHTRSWSSDVSFPPIDTLTTKAVAKHKSALTVLRVLKQYRETCDEGTKAILPTEKQRGGKGVFRDVSLSREAIGNVL